MTKNSHYRGLEDTARRQGRKNGQRRSIHGKKMKTRDSPVVSIIRDLPSPDMARPMDLQSGLKSVVGEQNLLFHILDEGIPVQEIKAWLDDAFEVKSLIATAVLVII